MLKVIQDNKVELIAGNNIGLDESGRPVGALVDGSRDASFFGGPGGLTANTDGSLYVADTDNHAIRQVTDGVVTTWAGADEPGLTDGYRTEARFNSPLISLRR